MSESLRGVTPPSRPGGRPGFLDDVIVELGYAERETVEWAVEHGRHHGGSVGTVLVEGGMLSEDQVSRAIAELHGLEHVDLAEFEVDLKVARLISRQAARRYHAVPIGFDSEGSLIVALADPVDPLAVSDIAVMTRSEVHPMVATESSIDAAIAELEDAPGVEPPPAPGAAEVRDHQGIREPDYGPTVRPEARPANGEVAEELARAGAALAELSERLVAYEPRLREIVVPPTELERERARWGRVEEQLRTTLSEAEQASRRLEQRLAGILEQGSEWAP